MQITYYRHKKGVLRMHSRDMEYIVGLLKNGKDAEAILSVRRKLNMAFLARTTDLSGKLPVLAFGSTFKKNGDGIQLRRYNGYVLLEVNGLESQSEAEAVRREAAACAADDRRILSDGFHLAAKNGGTADELRDIVRLRLLPDGSLPKKEEQARMFHAAAYQLAVRHYQPQLGSIISLKEPFLSRGCRMSVDPDAYYNPDAVAIRIEQPLQMPDGGDLKIVPSPVRDPLEMMAPGADRNGQIATLFSVILMEMTRRFSESPEDDIQLLFIDLAQACCRLGIPEEEAVGWTLRYEALKKYKIDVRMAFRTAYTLENVSNRAEPLSSVPPSMSLVLRLDEFMNRRYFFRTNEMSDDTVRLQALYDESPEFHLPGSPAGRVECMGQGYRPVCQFRSCSDISSYRPFSWESSGLGRKRTHQGISRACPL